MNGGCPTIITKLDGMNDDRWPDASDDQLYLLGTISYFSGRSAASHWRTERYFGNTAQQCIRLFFSFCPPSCFTWVMVEPCLFRPPNLAADLVVIPQITHHSRSRTPSLVFLFLKRTTANEWLNWNMTAVRSIHSIVLSSQQWQPASYSNL